MPTNVYEVNSRILAVPEKGFEAVERVRRAIEESGWKIQSFSPKAEDFRNVSAIRLGLFPPFTTRRSIRVKWRIFFPGAVTTPQAATEVVKAASKKGASGFDALSDWTSVVVSTVADQPDIIKRGIEDQVRTVKGGIDSSTSFLEDAKPWLIGGGALLGLLAVASITSNVTSIVPRRRRR